MVENTQEILRKTFDIEVHKKSFTNYLEVVILEDGSVEYAVPSHQLKLIDLSCKRLNISKDELEELCPQEYYTDFMYWLTMQSKAVAVWNTFTEGEMNQKQRDALLLLKREGLYKGRIPE